MKPYAFGIAMEKDFIGMNSLVELDFLIHAAAEVHSHEHFELLYLLHGHLTVTVEEEAFLMNPKDMILINAKRKHSYEGSEDVFIGRFSISHSKTRELLGQDMVLFWCNSIVDKNEAYDELRKVITRIFNQHIKYDSKRQIYLNSLYYQMLHILTGNFLLTGKDLRYEAEQTRTDDRMQEIYQYIRSHYRKSIKLQDLSERLFLSPAYLSKYIKKQCDSSFVELLNSVRLNYAMEELIYTDSSIMKIAMDNGFASVAAYNKAFKEAYKTTPSEFRRQVGVNQKKISSEAAKQEKLLIEERMASYLQDDTEELDDGNGAELYVCVNPEQVAKQSWQNNSSCLINIGTASDLRKSVFQEQVLYLKQQLGVEYVRFWDIYAPDLYLDIHASGSELHFGRIDEVLDFLVKNKLKPYLELGFKPLRLLKNTQNALLEISREQEFCSDEEMSGFFRELLKHFIHRYGAEEVQTWYFEYWKKENLHFSELVYEFQPMTEDVHQEYFHRFDLLARAFRQVLPEVQLGGGGFSMQHYGREGFGKILKEWKRSQEQPDFISLNCYPYQLEREGTLYFEKKSTDMYFVEHNLLLASEVMAEYGLETIPVHVSEYSLTLSNRNAINDHCAKGAFLIQNAIACMGITDVMGHWLAADTYADFHDTQSFLFGGCGFMTKTGVPKPGFYAFEYLSHLYKHLLAKEKNYVLTGNSRGAFRMVSHNFKLLNYNYYLTDESEIQIQDIPQMFENHDSLVIKVTLQSVANGVYMIKNSLVNQEFGSVLDEWVRLNMETQLTMQEQDYLKRISTPRLSAQEICVENHVLEFELTLKPNEMRYTQIVPK
ncbi:MAG: GH39 family glycosyl hydrolase [Lachnospiraceae bacterium]